MTDSRDPMDLAPVGPQESAPISAEFGPHTLSQARERLDVLAGLKRLAIAYTTPDEWQRFGEKPYLEASGAMKFAEVFGVSFTDAKVETVHYTDERGPVTEFYASVVAHFRGRTCPAEGVASTADEFFNGKEPDPDEPSKKRARRLPMSEIDRPSVRKKALTQAMATATKKILGLSFTWDEVQAALGDRAANVGSVAFGGKSEFAGEAKKAGKGQMSPVKTELLRIVMDLAQGDQEVAKEFLYTLTKFKDKEGNERGSRSILDMSDAWAAKTLPRAKAMKEKADAQDRQAAEMAGEDG